MLPLSQKWFEILQRIFSFFFFLYQTWICTSEGWQIVSASVELVSENFSCFTLKREMFFTWSLQSQFEKLAGRSQTVTNVTVGYPIELSTILLEIIAASRCHQLHWLSCLQNDRFPTWKYYLIYLSMDWKTCLETVINHASNLQSL